MIYVKLYTTSVYNKNDAQTRVGNGYYYSSSKNGARYVTIYSKLFDNGL